ncbi:MAG: glycosyltransferase [Bacteroidota bacterium]
MRILMMSDSLIKGGRERRLIELLKGLTPLTDYTVDLVLLSERVDYKEVFDLDVNIRMMPRKFKQDPSLFPRFFSLCKELKPDLIHCWGSLSSVIGLPAAKTLGIKFINATIADAPKNTGLLHKKYMRSRLTFPFSDAVVGNSFAGLKAYDAPEAKSYCMHNGFDFNRISNLESEQSVRERLDVWTPHIIGMVGAFADRKDYHTYIQAALEIVQSREDVTFLAIGGGKNLETIKSMVAPEWQERIRFTGQLDGVESVAAQFSVGVLCTNQEKHGEGISNSILEYMALGKPVVATDGGGTSEIVVNGETGFTVPAKDVSALREKLEYLLDNPEAARQMGNAGHDRVREHFNLDNMVEKYIDLYHRVMGSAVPAH